MIFNARDGELLPQYTTKNKRAFFTLRGAIEYLEGYRAMLLEFLQESEMAREREDLRHKIGETDDDLEVLRLMERVK